MLMANKIIISVYFYFETQFSMFIYKPRKEIFREYSNPIDIHLVYIFQICEFTALHGPSKLGTMILGLDQL